MNRINQKGTRPQDVPVALSDLAADDQALIQRHYPELFGLPNPVFREPASWCQRHLRFYDSNYPVVQPE